VASISFGLEHGGAVGMQLGVADARRNPIEQRWLGHPYAKGAGGPHWRQHCGRAGIMGWP